MNRRDLLTKCGLFLAVPTAIGLSGCSSGDGGDDNGDDDSEDDTPTATATPVETPEQTPTASDGDGGEYTREEMGELVTDEIGEIEILGWTSEVLDGPSLFQVEVTLRNAGNQDTRITPGAFALVITYYDDNGSTLGEGRHSRVERRTLPSGETAFVSGNVELDDPSVVASYDLSLTCDENSMSVYC
jgi:hypothetical protein